MWVQVIQGRVKDEAGLRKQFDRWQDEIRPNVTGFLGATSGFTDDGRFFTVARFESEELAMQNSNDPKQTAWWEETAEYFDGEPTFHNCSEVDTMRNGGRDDAGFVQIMQSGVTDWQRMRALGQRMNEEMPADMRPEFIGGIAAWDGETLTQVAYFTSEEEARKGEQQDMTAADPNAAEMWQEMDSMIVDLKYYDLHEPMMI